MSESVTVQIDRNGQITMEVNGVKGKRCLDVTASMVQALGEVTSHVPTDDMTKPPDTPRGQERGQSA
jgi:hypothetical protein